ncbi:MAG TPA: GatB/YqeY domain-containing protein [Candidatus Saccharimonadales bacterium]
MIDQIDADLKQAMLSRDELKVSVLRGLKNALANEKIKTRQPLSPEQEITVLKREAKQRDEAAAGFTAGGAKDRAEKERLEKTIIENYLPQMIDDEDLDDLIEQAINRFGQEAKQTGAIIGYVMSQSGGRVDGAKVAALVKQRLAA